MSREAGARLFVAVDLPPAVRESLAGWAREARRGRTSMRPLDSDMLHVTACFLGLRAMSDIEAIAGVLDECAGSVAAPALALGAPVWLPPRRPRALAVELRDESGHLLALARALSGRLAVALDWQADSRRYRPHVTVARMSAGAAPRERALPPTPSHRFEADTVTLYRSWLDPGGASYEPLARAELGGLAAR